MKNNNFENFYLIYNKYYKKIFFLVLKNCKNKSLSESITQEIFVSTLSKIKSLKNINSFDAWLTKIALNKINLYFKILIKYRENNIYKKDISELTHIADKNISIEKLIMREDLKTLINKLSEKEKETILLFYYDQLSLKEISLVNNISIGTVKSRLFSAKKKLRIFYEKSLAFLRNFYSKFFNILIHKKFILNLLINLILDFTQLGQ